MNANKRRLAIEALLQDTGEVDYSELAVLFGVSEMTARRDVEQLEVEGKARRVFKGAISTTSRRHEPSVLERSSSSRDAKLAMARIAVGLVSPGDAIYLDAGTSNYALAEALAGIDFEIFVVTPNLRAVTLLTQNPLIKVAVCGGFVRPGEQSVVGSDAEGFLRGLNVDTAFLGAAGLHLGRGVTDFGVEETRVKQAILANAHRRVLLLDHTKIGRIGLCAVCSISEIDVLVSDMPAEHDAAAALEHAGIRLELVPSSDNPAAKADPQ